MIKAAVFDPSVEAPGWDQGRRYAPSSVVLYFEDQDQNLHHIPQESGQ
jgi:hypothetical protein